MEFSLLFAFSLFATTQVLWDAIFGNRNTISKLKLSKLKPKLQLQEQHKRPPPNSENADIAGSVKRSNSKRFSQVALANFCKKQRRSSVKPWLRAGNEDDKQVKQQPVQTGKMPHGTQADIVQTIMTPEALLPLPPVADRSSASNMSISSRYAKVNRTKNCSVKPTFGANVQDGKIGFPKPEVLANVPRLTHSNSLNVS